MMASINDIFKGEEKYQSGGLKNTLHGNIYQLKLLMLFLLKGNKNYSDFDFELGTEVKDAEKFDDVVFQSKSNEFSLMLQAKHKQNQGKEVIKEENLFLSKNENKKEKDKHKNNI
jgi:hypothetical protein